MGRASLSILGTRAGLAVALAACIEIPQVQQRSDTKVTDDDAGPPTSILEAGTGPADTAIELAPADPHALLGVDPAHGSFAGGETRLVRGNGFSSKLRVWVGGTEVAKVTVVDPTRAQITAPPGDPGPADVSTQNGTDASTLRTLAGGYAYDAFFATPSSGPTSGGTVIQLTGKGTAWNATSTVDVGGAPCTGVNVASATSLTCTVPKSPAGARSVTVTTGNQPLTVLDAFTYADSDNGFKGGLSGSALASSLKVLVFDDYTGDPIPNALVIADDDTTDLRMKTDASGVALFQADAGSLGPKRSVTIAKRCYQPATFVDVPVDTVTAYLDPIESPACTPDGDPTTTGGRPADQGTISGELVWTGGIEEQRPAWTNVPAPVGPDEQQAAYVFTVQSDPAATFYLPDESLAIHPDASGSFGYAYSLGTWGGNTSLYAVAGIENRKASPQTFTAYAMGLVQGVFAKPGQTTDAIYIPMDVTLDQAVTFTVSGPAVGPRGPDRLFTTLSLAIGNDGYATIPGMQRTTLLPAPATWSFVGAPGLAGSMAGQHYVATARAATGSNLSEPRSIIGARTFTNAGTQVALADFLQVPVLDAPTLGGSWAGTSIAVHFAASASPPDVLVYEVDDPTGSVSWTIAAPGDRTSVTLPDLAAAGPDLAMPAGPVTIHVSAARIPQFDYGNLRYRNLAPRGWTDYATDAFPATYTP